MHHDANSGEETLRALLTDGLRLGGWVRDIGPEHIACLQPGIGEGAATLLVSFEMMDATLARGRVWPERLAERRGWSTLTILSRGRSFYRDPALAHLFDEMTDEGDFDDYDQVIFMGGGTGGYAAAAYSVAAPGAMVIAIAPLATLDRSVAPWERRFRSAWSLDWTTRYGFAPDMIDAASQVFVISDPTEAFDSMHASLFRGSHVAHLRATHAGPDLAERLEAIGILDRLVAGAASGSLTPLRFAQLWRGRRRDRVWLARVMRKLDRLDRPWLSALFARHVTERHDLPAFRRRLATARAQLLAEGRDLPERAEARRAG
ncbi:hypothetical protein [Jannaschia aquimarina]|uniref:Phosphoadenosine phosphosulfate reductase n=1 Tax=Jannaschia aquimarina TaxID=935700 RepID=A0A0D1EKN4_9RHOB|nr:hypothetical protein [Jannaschia aquimarina]KIT18154.1 hypothetical protein jaqu_00880 [Jannaschia aquimarina]SNT30581.1 hypothetical protein SAMN05421775_110145 [Jannaschia aquimarina]